MKAQNWDFKSIEIFYWECIKYEDLPYEHYGAFKYSKKKLHEIIDLVLSKGYGLKMKDYKDRVVLIIDKGYFKQKPIPSIF